MRFLSSRSHTIVDAQATGNLELPADYNLNRHYERLKMRFDSNDPFGLSMYMSITSSP